LRRLWLADAAILGQVAVGVSSSWGEQIRGIAGNHRLRPSRNSDEEEAMKKLGFMTLLITATLLFTLAFSAAATGPKAPATPVPAVAAVPAAPAPVATPERHPHIDEALEQMRAAKHQLESAEHDFDGHRAKSLEHLNQAIHEAEVCMSMK
jgi:hypothetical protein